MLAGLARNTALSALAFGINGLIALALVPVLVASYGIAAFGLVVLSRTLLPTGALGALDFGMAETATQSVGRARGSGDWSRASQEIGFLLALAAAIGLLAAGTLAAAAPRVADLFHVDAAHRESFAAILVATAAALVVFFPGLVAEGVVKGFERFGVLRGVEVLATLLYAGASVAAVLAGLSYAAVAYAFLGAIAARYLVLGTVAAAAMRAVGMRPAPWGRQAREEMTRRSLLMFHGKVLGALQMPVPPLVIGALVGPAGVGIYEVVTRLPRFLKSTLSLLASAVLPVAARLEGRGASDRLGRLAEKSFWLVPYATFPVLFAAGGLARPILSVWVGPELAAYWPWLAVMLVFPVLNICLTFSQSMLQVRADYIAASNRISTLGIAVQYAVSFALVKPLGSMSFVLGIALASAAVFPFQLRLIARALELDPAPLWSALLPQAAVALAAAALGLAASFAISAISLPALAAIFGALLVACWAAAYGLFLGDNARALLGRLASSLLRGA